MKSYPPHKIFLNFLSVFLCVALLFFFFPGEKYEIKKIIPARFKDSSSLRTQSGRPPEISGLIHHSEDSEKPPSATTTQIDKYIFPEFVKPVGLVFNPDSRSAFIYFLKTLDSCINNMAQCGILHFGDSQLEEDRISKYLREKLQLKFGSGLKLVNIPQRGSAGLEFSESEPGWLSGLCGNLKPSLIILQYGINVAPAKTKDFSFYGELLKKEIRFLQQEFPDVPVLMIGVSDMAYIENGKANGYSSVKSVSEVQRNAAMETGVIFFDLLEFMGGAGSFILWKEAEPPLMRSDFTHFTFKGGQVVAEGIARAILEEFEKFDRSGGGGDGE